MFDRPFCPDTFGPIGSVLYCPFRSKMSQIRVILPDSDEFGDFDLVKVVFVLVHGTKDSRSLDDP